VLLLLCFASAPSLAQLQLGLLVLLGTHASATSGPPDWLTAIWLIWLLMLLLAFLSKLSAFAAALSG
jgi:hypothetical protein